MRKVIAVIIGKILCIAGRLAGKKSSAGPGAVALKICPDLVKGLHSMIDKKIIVVCGTNGKTTTNNIVCSALEKQGYKVMCNRVGANMKSGVATAYIECADLLGRVKADYACLEIDEAYARIIFKDFTPDIMIITNLFRDQLDRYGELDGTAGLIKDAIALCDDLTLVLNADDPVCVQFGSCEGVKAVYYGVSEKVLDQTEETNEGRFCPICGNELSYDFYHYSQLGAFRCDKCGYKRPTPDYDIKNVSLGTPMVFDINGERITSTFKGFYNVCNLAGAYVALKQLGEQTWDFSSLIEDYKPQTGRMQEFAFNKTVILSLSKNPAGFNQAITTINLDTRKKDIILAINDGEGDGKDVSWLWDVNFDKLYTPEVNSLAITGIRKYDTALRFKYDGIDSYYVTDSMKDAVVSALDSDSEVVYVMVNYTAMYSTEAILKELQLDYKPQG